MSSGTDSIPNRFDYSAAEPRIYQWWEEQGYFQASPDSPAPPFTIVIPPPNVTGALHLGHALNNSLQDILIRFRRMQGYNTLWMPGTDHAGIATQAVVERRLREEEGKSRHDLGREALVARIWEWKAQYEARILGQLKQMGCSCDWRRTRFTLDEVCARAVRRTFFDLFQKQLIYRGKRLVNWDTFLQTAVSDDEVKNTKMPGNFWHFRYPVIDPLPGEPEYVTIATTRPETMLGDTAVAVHPDPAAALAKLEAELRDKLAGSGKERAEIEQQLERIAARRTEKLAELEQLRDMAAAGRMLRLPLLDREIPLVADEWAKPELGSGCVKITPAHDPNDYQVGLRCDLPMINILNVDGTLNEDAGTYRGLTIPQAREQVVADLDALGLLGDVERRDIELPLSDRSKTPVEPFLADQWFVRMGELAQSAINAVEDGRVKIFPPRYAKGYVDWLAEKRDWPVSRQLWWGHQIPVWSRTCPTEAEYDTLWDQLQKDPAVAAGTVAVQVERPEQRLHSASIESQVALPHAVIHVCVADELPEVEQRLEQLGLVREEDVLDTWFSSALWPHSTLGWPEKTPELKTFYPTSTLITSRDIITLWVARMVITGLNNMGDVPFHEVFIHPKILDGEGETMSKSKGNGIDPLDVIDKFGADALRFAMAHLTTETQDVRMPVEFECPNCEALIKQTSKNRTLPKIECPKCQQAFSTQWAAAEEDLVLPRGPVVSERFEQARNFGNKLWNAARFALLNLEGYQPAEVAASELSVEDRWLLSRLDTVTAEVTEALAHYHYADAARALYGFAWNDFCSFYVEMAKLRLQDDAARPVAQRVLAHALDVLLRLLHPMIPFITEEIWQALNQAAPRRGLTELQEASSSIMVAPWPAAAGRVDQAIEAQFNLFQEVLGGIREIRSRQNLPPKARVEFRMRCADEVTQALAPLAPYFEQLATAAGDAWGPDVETRPMHATVTLNCGELYVNLREFIDVEAEIARLQKQIDKTLGMIQGKEKKLGNASFVDRAPPEVVARERESVEQLRQQVESARVALEELREDE